MNSDCMSLIKNITLNNPISLSEVSNLVGVGERSLRYKINDCNYYLKQLSFPEILIKKKMLYFSIQFEELMQKIRENLYIYSFSKEEREEIILSYYLFRDENITIDEISESLQVTNVTLKNDLKRIKNKLNEFDLKLENINNKGLKIVGNEASLRKIILELFSRHYALEYSEKSVKIKKQYSNSFFLLWDEMDVFFDQNEAKEIFSSLKMMLERTSRKISDDDFKNIFFYILITLKRKDNYAIELQESNKFLIESEEFQIIKEILYKYQFSNSELCNITEYLFGSRTYKFNTFMYREWFEVEAFVTKLIQLVANEYDGIQNDKTLIDGLINHIKPAIFRIQNNISLETLMYDEFKKTYPKVLNIIEKGIKFLEKPDLVFPDEEVSYIAMHFYLAIERQRNKSVKNILIVCGSGYSTSRFLEKNIVERFSVNVIDVIPYNEFSKYKNCEQIDLIITTLKKIENIPEHKVITVSPILSKIDLENLSNYGLKLINKKISLSEILEIAKQNSSDLDERNFAKMLKDKFGSEIIDDIAQVVFPDLLQMLESKRIKKLEKVKSWEDAVKLSSHMLIQDDYINKEYLDEIYLLVEKYGNYMTIRNGVFLAHARDISNVNKTGFSLLVLDEAIEFPENENINIIITLSSKDKREHLEGLLELMEVLDSENFIQKMKDCNTNNEIYKIIKEILEYERTN